MHTILMLSNGLFTGLSTKLSTVLLTGIAFGALAQAPAAPESTGGDTEQPPYGMTDKNNYYDRNNAGVDLLNANREHRANTAATIWSAHEKRNQGLKKPCRYLGKSTTMTFRERGSSMWDRLFASRARPNGDAVCFEFKEQAQAAGYRAAR